MSDQEKYNMKHLQLSEQELNQLVYLLNKLPIEELDKVNVIKSFLNDLWDKQHKDIKEVTE